MERFAEITPLFSKSVLYYERKLDMVEKGWCYAPFALAPFLYRHSLRSFTYQT